MYMYMHNTQGDVSDWFADYKLQVLMHNTHTTNLTTFNKVHEVIQ